uniref:Uncharacterized protein n=1 Tax=Pyrodinium bahamense TaxID=73915 RepID=A0A7R9ZZE5_9DINO
MPGERVKVKTMDQVIDGDAIGMLISMERRALAFLLNGALQGACHAPDGPLYLTTSLDKEGDRVELRRHCPEEAPSSAHEALCGPLLGRPWPAKNDAAADDFDSGEGEEPLGKDRGEELSGVEAEAEVPSAAGGAAGEGRAAEQAEPSASAARLPARSPVAASAGTSRFAHLEARLTWLIRTPCEAFHRLFLCWQ